MSVDIEPAELGFRRPFSAEVAETLTIRNPNSMPVAFKVKTTAPKQYCVRPNSGRIEPDREVEVTVLLQAMKQDPPADYKCRDKFLVQSIPITSDKDFVSVGEIWQNAAKTDVQEKKIRVAFLPADDTDGPAPVATPARPTTTNGVDATPDVPLTSYMSPHEESRAVNGIPVEVPSSHRKPSTPAVPAPAADPPSTSGSASSAPAFAAPARSAASTSDKDATIAALTAKLAEAEALISSLRSDGGLRQRKGAAGLSEKSADVKAPSAAEKAQPAPVIQQGTEGVPVKIVAILCLLCFLLAYFFF